MADPVRWGRETLKQSVKNSGDPFLSHKFGLEIDNVTVDGCTKIDGLEFELAVVEYHNGDDKVARYRPGKLMPSSGLVVERDFNGSPEFFNWRKKVIDGVTSRSSISVVFKSDNAANTEVKRINLFNAFPHKWEGPQGNAKSSGHLSEALHITFEEIDFGK
jgi:phage tail-like protein